MVMVRVKGLEPLRLAAPDPKSGASTDSATPAWEIGYPATRSGARGTAAKLVAHQLCRSRAVCLRLLEDEKRRYFQPISPIRSHATHEFSSFATIPRGPSLRRPRRIVGHVRAGCDATRAALRFRGVAERFGRAAIRDVAVDCNRSRLTRPEFSGRGAKPLSKNNRWTGRRCRCCRGSRRLRSARPVWRKRV